MRKKEDRDNNNNNNSSSSSSNIDVYGPRDGVPAIAPSNEPVRRHLHTPSPTQPGLVAVRDRTLGSAATVSNPVSIVATLCGSDMHTCSKAWNGWWTDSFGRSDSLNWAGHNWRQVPNAGISEPTGSPGPTDDATIPTSSSRIAPVSADNSSSHSVHRAMKIAGPTVGAVVVVLVIAFCVRKRRLRNETNGIYSIDSHGSSSGSMSAQEHALAQPEMVQAGPAYTPYTSNARLRPPPPNVATLDVAAIAQAAPVQLAATSPHPRLQPITPRGHSMFCELPPEELPPYVDPIVEAMSPIPTATSESSQASSLNAATNTTNPPCQNPPPYHTIDTPVTATAALASASASVY